MPATGTLEFIARELAVALQPLEARLAGGGAQQFLVEIGIRIPSGVGGAADAISRVVAKASALLPAVTRLDDAIDDENPIAIVNEGGALITTLRELFDAIGQLRPAFDGAVLAAPGLSVAQRTHLQGLISELPRRMLDRLLLDYLETKRDGFVSALAVTGLVDNDEIFGDPADPTAPSFRQAAIHLDKLGALLTDPARYLRETFGFGQAGFDGLELLPRLADYLEQRRFTTMLMEPPGVPPLLEAFFASVTTDPAANPPALRAEVRFPATADITRTYPISAPWSISTSARSRFAAGVVLTAAPPLNVTVTPQAGLIIDADAAAIAERPGQTMLLFGQAGGTRLEVGKFSAKAGFRASAATGVMTAEPSLRVDITGGRVVIDLSAGDGFIRTVTGGTRIESSFDVAASWSPSSGLSFEGNGGIEIAIPMHTAFGPIDVTQLYLRLGVDPDGSLPFEISGGFSAALGPIQASVDRIGIIARSRFPAGGGNLGPIDLSIEFKSPTGIGLAVDAGVVKGGGFLQVDAARGEYSGLLELDLSGIVTVKAIGLISTRMPDGSSGFSLLIIITAEFGTGIQLGFGFTLLAVGGLLGLNRTMNLAALAEGVRSNAITSVMFPRDIVANAPRIISDLRVFFPVHEGTFLIGPMVKLGWGTPTLISLSVGVIIEIPGNVAIVGVLRLALPADELGILVLQVNFIGAIEFDRARLWFFAALFDSHILFLTIEGEIGVLSAFGDDANLVLTVGGLHPSFSPPPLPFPVPRRIAIDILNSPTAKLRVEGYFAVTSNTAQFGARVDARLGFDDFGISGFLAFDALFQFSPLHFVITISAGFSLKAFGVGVFSISLHLQLEGPTPWRAQGTGSISLLFFDIDVDFDITWGEDRPTTLPPIEVLALLKREYAKPETWRALLPAGNNLLVSLRKLDPVVDTLVLHPVGVLRVSQRAVPLDLTISKVGNRTATDGKRFALKVVSPGLGPRGPVDESFAPAQYQDFADADRLSKPAFQPMHGGLDLSVDGQQLASGGLVKRVIRYELITIDSAFRKFQRFVLLPFLLLTHFLKGAAVTKSPLSVFATSQLLPFPEVIAIVPETFAVASQADNVPIATFTSHAMALDHVATLAIANPNAAAVLHVIPSFEAAA